MRRIVIRHISVIPDKPTPSVNALVIVIQNYYLLYVQLRQHFNLYNKENYNQNSIIIMFCLSENVGRSYVIACRNIRERYILGFQCKEVSQLASDTVSLLCCDSGDANSNNFPASRALSLYQAALHVAIIKPFAASIIKYSLIQFNRYDTLPSVGLISDEMYRIRSDRMYLQLYESEIHYSYNCSAITFLILLKKSLHSISLKTENTLQQ